MSTALVISLGAVAISLFVVFVAAKAARVNRGGKDDGYTVLSSDGSAADCVSSDSGSCDGGGGD